MTVRLGRLLHNSCLLNSCKMNRKEPDVEKVHLRNVIADKLAALTKEEKARQSKIIYYKLISNPNYKSAQRISIYLSTDTEVDTTPILKNMQESGKMAFVPQYAGGVMKMLLLQMGDLDAMVETKHGILQHEKDVLREDAIETGGLDLIITPGVAFTKQGHRLGHGGGYYDKYISKAFARHEQDSKGCPKPKLIALAFKEQVCEAVPTNSDDQIVDEVITVD